jgi:hypothetical protein
MRQIASYLDAEYNLHNGTVWRKVRGEALVKDSSKVSRAEIHWFESDATGRLKVKLIRMFDDES